MRLERRLKRKTTWANIWNAHLNSPQKDHTSYREPTSVSQTQVDHMVTIAETILDFMNYVYETKTGLEQGIAESKIQMKTIKSVYNELASKWTNFATKAQLVLQ